MFILSAESQRLDGELFANSVDGIELFPCEKLYLACERCLVVARKGLGDSARHTADVTVGGSLAIYRVAELQPLLDGVGAHIEDFLDLPGDLRHRSSTHGLCRRCR